MRKLVTLGLLLGVAASFDTGDAQTKKIHILFSSDSHGYVDPCG